MFKIKTVFMSLKFVLAVIDMASSLSDTYMEKPRFSIAQLILVGGLSFFLGGSASIALYAYIASFRRAMKDAQEMEQKQKHQQKLREHDFLQKRQSQISMRHDSSICEQDFSPKRQSQISIRHDPSIASYTSIDNIFGRNKVYDVENVMRESMFEKEEPFYSTLDKKCALKTFTIKDL